MQDRKRPCAKVEQITRAGIANPFRLAKVFMLVCKGKQQSIVFRRDMRGAALDAINAREGWQRIFNNQLSGLVSNTQGLPVITDHINQRS